MPKMCVCTRPVCKPYRAQDPVFKLYSRDCWTFVNILTGGGHFDKPYVLRMSSRIEGIESERIIKKSQKITLRFGSPHFTVQYHEKHINLCGNERKKTLSFSHLHLYQSLFALLTLSIRFSYRKYFAQMIIIIVILSKHRFYRKDTQEIPVRQENTLFEQFSIG